MGTLSLTCPHCHVRNTQFRSSGEHKFRDAPSLFTVFFVCSGCDKGVMATIQSVKLHAPHQTSGSLETRPFVIAEVYPREDELAAPEHTPANIAAVYIQAIDSLRAKHYDAAGAMCRKVVDIATKKLAPTHDGNLYSRIDALATANKITPQLAEWAHAIRLDGNDAAHEETPFTEQDATDITNFTELFLMYVFTLPGMLEARKKKDEPPRAAT